MDEEYVSTNTLRELLDQQKLFYKDMLDLKETNLKPSSRLSWIQPTNE